MVSSSCWPSSRSSWGEPGFWARRHGSQRETKLPSCWRYSGSPRHLRPHPHADVLTAALGAFQRRRPLDEELVAPPATDGLVERQANRPVTVIAGPCEPNAGVGELAECVDGMRVWGRAHQVGAMQHSDREQDTSGPKTLARQPSHFPGCPPFRMSSLSRKGSPRGSTSATRHQAGTSPTR